MKGIERIHCIGIGGIGVSAVARGAMALGATMSGSDVRESQLTEALRGEGATVTIGHDAALIEGADLVVYSTAVPDTNPELVAARASGVLVEHRAQLLGRILAEHEHAIGVVGTHGKGTVSSAITWLLDQAGLNPGFIIGGLLENYGINARVPEQATVIVAEVDESDGSLKFVHPTWVVVNNLEADHLNYYDSLEHIQDTVIEAFSNNPRLKRAFVNRTDAGAAALIPRIEALGVAVTTFGTHDASAVRAFDVELAPMSAKFSLEINGKSAGPFELSLPGAYNLDNAIGACAVALAMGVSEAAVAEALPEFKGLENRFTVVNAAGRRIIKDYISHPTGIRRVLEAAAADGRRITAVFKPYRFTMINYLQEDYAEAFHDASETVITKLYTAGEVPIPGINTEFLCEKIRSRGPKVTYIEDLDAVPAYLDTVVAEGEQAIFFGGDDLFRLADAWAQRLRDAQGA